MIVPVIFAFVILVASAATSQPYFHKGHDLPSLKTFEQNRTTYEDLFQNNASRPAEDILGDGGMNTVRLRLWVNPTPGQYDLPYVLDLAKRFVSKGYLIYLDYHFSVSWADPRKQFAPAAWPKSLEGLSETIRDSVKSTLLSFEEAGVNISIVSLGNEVSQGMVWSLGKVDVDIVPESSRVQNFTNLATIFKSARNGVDDAAEAGVKKPSVMIHLDNGGNTTVQDLWFSALTGSGIVTQADWEVFGFSFYPFYGPIATFANLKNTLDTLAAKYDKPMQVVETQYPVFCSGENTSAAFSEPSLPISVEGQLEWIHRIIDTLRQTPNGLGNGVYYWEPTWLGLTVERLSNCTDVTLFESDWGHSPKSTGYSRKSVNMYNY